MGSEEPIHSSKFVARSLPARYLLQTAYDIYPFQLLGGPDWLNSALFDIQAKSDSTAEDRLAKLSDHDARMEKQHMLQTLLAERFNLKVHWEQREMPIYALVVAKGGPKLHSAGSKPPSDAEVKRFGEGRVPLFYLSRSAQGQEAICHRCPLSDLEDVLWKDLGTTVIDRTGLIGTYDFTLQSDGAQPDETNSDPAHWPALTLAISDQLGLKLESTKDMVPVLVIDHMDKPSAN